MLVLATFSIQGLPVKKKELTREVAMILAELQMCPQIKRISF